MNNTKSYLFLILIAGLCFAGGVYFQGKKSNEEASKTKQTQAEPTPVQPKEEPKKEEKKEETKTVPQPVVVETPPVEEPEEPGEIKIDPDVMVFVQNNAIKQSGVVAKIKDRLFVVTTQNILFTNQPFSIRTNHGVELKYDGIFSAKSDNAVILRIANPPENLEFLPTSNTSIAQLRKRSEVFVLEKLLSTGVVNQEDGTARSTGGTRIEVDAYNDESYTGLAVVDKSDQHLIGITTGTITPFSIKKYDDFSYEDEHKLVGVCIDAITWDSVDQNILFRQIQQLQSINTIVYAIHALTESDADVYEKNPTVSTIIKNGMARTKMNLVQNELDADMKTMKNKLSAELVNALTAISNQSRNASGMMQPYYTAMSEYVQTVQKLLNETRFEVSVSGKASDRTAVLHIYR